MYIKHFVFAKVGPDLAAKIPTAESPPVELIYLIIDQSLYWLVWCMFRLLAYLTFHDLIYIDQYGFQAGNSMNFALLRMLGIIMKAWGKKTTKNKTSCYFSYDVSVTYPSSVITWAIPSFWENSKYMLLWGHPISQPKWAAFNLTQLALDVEFCKNLYCRSTVIPLLWEWYQLSWWKQWQADTICWWLRVSPANWRSGNDVGNH